MKKQIAYWTMVFVLSTTWVVAQRADSTSVVYTQEKDGLPLEHKSRYVRALYRRFVRAQIEERTLVKVGAFPTSGSHSADDKITWGFRTEVAIEQKLTPAFSVLLAAQSWHKIINYLPNETSITGVVAGRWYYSMDRRIREGKSANNFSSQYLTIQSSTPIWFSPIDPKFIPINNVKFFWAGAGIGAQRRLTRLGYMDANLIGGYAPNSPYPLVVEVSFLIGLGL